MEARGAVPRWNQGRERRGSGWVLGCLNNQVDGSFPPSLLQFPPADRREFSEQQKPRGGNTPYLSNPQTYRHDPEPKPKMVQPGPSLGSASHWQTHYLYLCTSLSLQGLEETFPNTEGTCEFPTPRRGSSHKTEPECV